jgi:hypothetical protein
MFRRLLNFAARRTFLAIQQRPVVFLVFVLLGLFAYGLQHLSASKNPGAHDPAVETPRLSDVFTPEVRHWSPVIYAWAQAYKVDPNLIATVIQIESCGDAQAVSRSGAQGLFQVMPSHFQPGEDMQDILTNGRRGMDYLAQGLELADGDAGLALAGYNGGHGVINMDRVRWSAETQRYYQWGSRIYQDAVQGRPTSQAVQDWLDAGGSRLCQQAANRESLATP